MLFMFFWVMNWIIGFGQMVLAGAFASYYWAWDKKEHMPVFPIMSSVGRTLLYVYTLPLNVWQWYCL